ncbi:MAG: ABC transporter ATP-binding protein [Gammaproteobacteria bacterium]|nr:ABC transporter ATP-binding protein [Gammaproteobacteria bacterium]
MLIQGDNLHREFEFAGKSITALATTSLAVTAGELLTLTGPSGSGKSTLLNLLSGLDRPSGGEVRFEDQPLNSFNDAQAAALRNRAFGFIFQTPHLLPYKTVVENVALPCSYGGIRDAQTIDERAHGLLEYVGLAEYATHYPRMLSAGELQRVVFARALINRPRVLFADEPTGSLDAENAHRVLSLLRQEAVAGKCVIMATHDAEAMRFATRRLNLDKFSHALPG